MRVVATSCFLLVVLAGALPPAQPARAGEIGDLLLGRAERMQPAADLTAATNPAGPIHRYRRIGLERGRTCAVDPCPSYTVLLYSDDSVLFTGQGLRPDSALPNGQVIAQLNAQHASELRAYLDAQRLGLADQPDDVLYGVPGSDAWAIVMLETDENIRLIVDYGHAAPAEVWALIGLLEHAAWSALHGSEFDR